MESADTHDHKMDNSDAVKRLKALGYKYYPLHVQYRFAPDPNTENVTELFQRLLRGERLTLTDVYNNDRELDDAGIDPNTVIPSFGQQNFFLTAYLIEVISDIVNSDSYNVDINELLKALLSGSITELSDYVLNILLPDIALVDTSSLGGIKAKKFSRELEEAQGSYGDVTWYAVNAILNSDAYESLRKTVTSHIYKDMTLKFYEWPLILEQTSDDPRLTPQDIITRLQSRSIVATPSPAVQSPASLKTALPSICENYSHEMFKAALKALSVLLPYEKLLKVFEFDHDVQDAREEVRVFADENTKQDLCTAFVELTGMEGGHLIEKYFPTKDESPQEDALSTGNTPMLWVKPRVTGNAHISLINEAATLSKIDIARNPHKYPHTFNRATELLANFGKDAKIQIYDVHTYNAVGPLTDIAFQQLVILCLYGEVVITIMNISSLRYIERYRLTAGSAFVVPNVLPNAVFEATITKAPCKLLTITMS